MRVTIPFLLLTCAFTCGHLEGAETPDVPGPRLVSCEQTLETCMSIAESQQPGRIHHDEVMCRMQYEQCRRGP